MTTPPVPPGGLELRDVPRSDPWETIRRGRRLVSSKVGLLRGVVLTRYQAQDPVMFCTGVQPSDLARSLGEGHGRGLKAGGAAFTAAGAVAAAIGEAVERHSSFFYDRDAMVPGTWRELQPHAVSPDLLRLFTREQLERGGAGAPGYFDEDAPTRWVWGHSLTERRPRLVPAPVVYMNYRPADDELRAGLNTSTGLAAGPTREEAILGGLLEVVERDAFTLAWLHRQAGRRVEVDDPELREMLRLRLWADRPGVDVKVFELTTESGIPVLFLALRRQAEFGPFAAVGCAARLSPREALVKCVQEAGQNTPFVRYLLESQKDWQPAPDFSNVDNFERHFLTYVKRPDLIAPAFAFLDECPRRVELGRLDDRSTGGVRGDIERCVALLGAAGHEVIVVDLTTPDVAEVGFSVVRVIVPGLVPLHTHHLQPYLGVRRLAAAPARLGWDRRGEAAAALNPFPHPFP